MLSASGVSGDELGRGLPYRAFESGTGLFFSYSLQFGWYRGVFRPIFLGQENFFCFFEKKRTCSPILDKLILFDYNFFAELGRLEKIHD